MRRSLISCDLPSDVGVVGLRVDAIDFAGLDACVNRCGALAARL